MSMAEVERFLDRCGEDPELGAQAVHIWTKVIDNPGEAMMKLARESGFDFTPEEGGQAWERIQATGELPDALLELAAGGGGSTTGPCSDDGK